MKCEMRYAEGGLLLCVRLNPKGGFDRQALELPTAERASTNLSKLVAADACESAGFGC